MGHLTNADAIDLIKAKIGGEDNDLRNRVAANALKLAIGAFNRIGDYEWNRQQVTFSLTSGTGTYLFSDLWPDYKVKRLESRIWFVNHNGWIDVKSYHEFNNITKHQSAVSGVPQIASVHSLEKQIDIWPLPNSAYSCVAMLYLQVDSLGGIPEEYHDLVVEKAIMFAIDTSIKGNIGIYESSKLAWDEGIKAVKNNDSYITWNDNQINPDPYITQSSTRPPRYVDSGNLTGR